MRKTYTAYDNTHFDDIIDCFNYEWQNLYSNMEIYDLHGNQISDFNDVADDGYIIHVYDIDTRSFIESYFFLDEWFPDMLDDSIEGYYVADGGYYNFYTCDNFLFTTDAADRLDENCDLMAGMEA